MQKCILGFTLVPISVTKLLPDVPRSILYFKVQLLVAWTTLVLKMTWKGSLVGG